MLFYYTNDKVYKAIRSQVPWLFKASKPPGDHPKAAYFTTLAPGAANLAKRLFVRDCPDKIAFVFSFSGGEDLTHLEGGRGAFIFYSVEDYSVGEERQGPHGPTEKVQEDEIMIGGVDVVIPTSGGSAALEACARIVQRRWPNARFEDAETGEKYANYGAIPFERVSELFAYSDAQVEAAWGFDEDDSPPNSMLYLIRSPAFITVVLDDPNTVDMQAMIGELRIILRGSSSDDGGMEKDKHPPAIDPVEPFIGALPSDVPDWASQHDKYLGETLADEMRASSGPRR
ncbi:MAG: hypothetical protein ACRELG_27875 [Gemmataceae bacterium]